MQRLNTDIIAKEEAYNNYDSESDDSDPQGLLEQFWLVVSLSVGPIVSMFFYMFVQLVNTYYIGHTNEPALIAGVGMGNMLINVLAFAII